MHRTPVVVLSAVTLVAAFGLSGCTGEQNQTATSRTTTPTAASAVPNQATLPEPEALAQVVAQLADNSLPVEQKIGLVQYATVEDGPALNNFGEALKDNGFVPLTVEAADLKWSPTPGNVTANVTLATEDPKVSPFTYPMEFSPLRDTWQLTRKMADQLLPLVGKPATTPTS